MKTEIKTKLDQIKFLLSPKDKERIARSLESGELDEKTLLELGNALSLIAKKEEDLISRDVQVKGEYVNKVFTVISDSTKRIVSKGVAFLEKGLNQTEMATIERQIDNL